MVANENKVIGCHYRTKNSWLTYLTRLIYNYYIEVLTCQKRAAGSSQGAHADYFCLGHHLV